MKKICEKFIEKGLAKEINIDFGQIEKILQKSKRSIQSAKLLLQNGDDDAPSNWLMTLGSLPGGRCSFPAVCVRERPDRTKLSRTSCPKSWVLNLKP